MSKLRCSICVIACMFSVGTRAASNIHAPLADDLFQRPAQSTPLSLANLTLVSSDSFATCDGLGEERFSAVNKGYRWFAENGSMGWHNLGDFVSPEAARRKNLPPTIDCSLGHLRLSLIRTGDGRWLGAQIKTYSYGGHGLLLPYGYWELDAMFPPLPPGFVPWAAMWFVDRLSTTPTGDVFEFDAFETGMHATTERTFDTTVHRWAPRNMKGGSPTSAIGDQKASTPVDFNVFDGKRHRYGLLRTKEWHILYVDGQEKIRFPTLAEDMQRPVSLLVDLAIALQPTNSAVDRYGMHVFGVKIYKPTH